MSNHIYDESVGLFKKGSIIGYDSVKNILKIRLNTASAVQGQVQSIDVPAPHSLFYNNGLFKFLWFSFK